MNSPIIIESLYYASPKKIWQALTEKEVMKKWYFDVSDFKTIKGFQFTFKGENEGRTFIHICSIKEIKTEELLTYTWQYEGFAGLSEVSFELIKENDYTRLKLTHKGLETFPQENPDFARSNFEKGWQYLIEKSLKEFVEN